MLNDLEAPTEAERPRLGKAGIMVRFTLIGVALAAIAGTFAYFGGWFNPNELTPAGRLGNAVGSALSDCPLWILAFA